MISRLQDCTPLTKNSTIPDIHIPKGDVPEKVKLGDFYLVPHVVMNEAIRNTLDFKLLTGRRINFVPVLGGFHDDAEIINFPYLHIHIDFRFLNVDYSRFVTRNHLNLMTYVLVAEIPDKVKVVLKRRKCRHQTRKFPKTDFAAKLEEAFEGKKAVGAICPHRGLRLSDGHKTKTGDIICAGHGLCWDKNGSVKRTSFEPPQRRGFFHYTNW